MRPGLRRVLESGRLVRNAVVRWVALLFGWLGDKSAAGKAASVRYDQIPACAGMTVKGAEWRVVGCRWRVAVRKRWRWDEMGGGKIGIRDWKKLVVENPLTSGRASPTILSYRLNAPLSWGGRPATAQGRAEARRRRRATAAGGLTTE